MIYIPCLGYSFHLSNDKNKKNSSKASAKSNLSGTTSNSNNAIQNAAGLSKCDNHNCRKYDDREYDIEIIRGSNSIVNNVKKLYKDEFEEARIEYNNQQIRDDRKIKDYFTHVSNNTKKDLACEIIIELGDMEFWSTKDMDYKKKMTNVFEEQVKSLEELVPDFKIASAIIHYDETSPHLHIIGVPIKSKNKYGMSKQVGKSDVFTKETLTKIQDKIRIQCMESFNKEYHTNYKLKPKLKGRNRDYHISKMENYQKMKKSLEIHQNALNKAKGKTDNLKNKIESKDEKINDLKEENSLLKTSLEHLKNLIYNLVKFLMDKIYRNKDKEKYMEFAKELYEHGALDKEDFDLIANPNKSNNSKGYNTIEKDDIES